MTDPKSFDNISLLLNSFAGVESGAAYLLEGNRAQLRFRTDSFDSLKQICDCVAMCNESVTVEPQWCHFPDETVKNDKVCFTVTIEEDWNDDAPPSRSQMIGIFMARDLKSKGRIDTAVADKMQKEWNAVVR